MILLLDNIYWLVVLNSAHWTLTDWLPNFKAIYSIFQISIFSFLAYTLIILN